MMNKAVVLLALFSTSHADQLKPRLVVLTDISPNDVEPNDVESMIRLLAHADLFEIEALVATTGWSNTGGRERIDLIRDALNAYEKDMPNLKKRSAQSGHKDDESRQLIGYWPSPEYLRSRTVKRTTTSGAPYETIVSNVVAVSYSDTDGLNAGTRYYYVLNAVNGGEEIEHSDETSAVPSAMITPEEYVIAEHAVIGGINLTLSVSNSVPGHAYQLWASDNLIAPGWQPVGVGQAGVGSNLEFNILVDGSSTNRYLKLEVQRQ